jgi:hypothetical protein
MEEAEQTFDEYGLVALRKGRLLLLPDQCLKGKVSGGYTRA